MSIIKYVFGLIGAAMLVGAFFLFTNTQEFLKTATTAEGTVTRLVESRSSDSTTYAPVIEFQTKDGSSIEFTSSTSSNPPSYSRGESVEVLYEESSPNSSATINGFFSLWGAALIVGILGLVFFLIGFVIIFLGIRRSKNVKYLKENGTPILAKFQNVRRNTSLEVNGRNPYQIVAQWQNPTTTKLHIFHSDNLWFDPTDHIESENISVLVDMNDLKKYYMDTSFLPEIAE